MPAIKKATPIARQAIEIVHKIRNLKPIGLKGEYHPFAKKEFVKHPFS